MPDRPIYPEQYPGIQREKDSPNKVALIQQEKENQRLDHPDWQYVLFVNENGEPDYFSFGHPTSEVHNLITEWFEENYREWFFMDEE